MALGLDISFSMSIRCEVPFSSETNILSFLLSTQYIFLPIQSIAIPSAPGRSCQTYTKYKSFTRISLYIPVIYIFLFSLDDDRQNLNDKIYVF